MAVIVRITCRECGQQADMWQSGGDFPPHLCSSCEEDKSKKKRDAHFSELDKLTMEQRVRKIEEWIYDCKPTGGPIRF